MKNRNAYMSLATAVTLCLSAISLRGANVNAAAPLPKVLTSHWLEQQLLTHDAKSVVDQLSAHQRFDYVMDQISSGKSDWIALAPKLSGGTDAGTAEELIISLALALPINPNSVLATLDLGSESGASSADVCDAPFIEGTVKNIPAYLRRSIKAVEAIKSPILLKQRTDCLGALHQAVGELRDRDN